MERLLVREKGCDILPEVTEAEIGPEAGSIRRSGSLYERSDFRQRKEGGFDAACSDRRTPGSGDGL